MGLTEAELRLSDFLKQRAQPGVAVDDIVAETLDALDRASRPHPSRSQLASKARLLAKAVADFEAILQDSTDLDFYLRNSQTLSGGLPWDHASINEGRQFDALTRNLPDALKAIREASLRLVDDKTPSPVLVRKGAPVDETRRGLGFELAGLFAFATGTAPTVSGEASIDSPNTDFGRFVALAAACRPYGDQLSVGFAKFLRSARSEFDKGAIKPLK